MLQYPVDGLVDAHNDLMLRDVYYLVDEVYRAHFREQSAAVERRG